MQVSAMTASACATSQHRGLMNDTLLFSPEGSSGWAQAPEIPAETGISPRLVMHSLLLELDVIW